jgi:prepilin-type N-terminal cleavage/methylation domain-containing protein
MKKVHRKVGWACKPNSMNIPHQEFLKFVPRIEKCPTPQVGQEKTHKSFLFRSPFLIFHSPRIAFTLAEVLITLAIIGVVAMMTIPALINKIQDMQFRTAAKEAYSKASQAIQQMQQDKGEDLNGIYHINTGAYEYMSFAPNFINYFKVIKYYGGWGWSDYNYKNLLNTMLVYNPMNYQFTTVDGMFWGCSANPGESSKGIGIGVDVNGNLKGPNIRGRDVFLFEVIGTSLLPMGAPNTDYPASTYCSRQSSGWDVDARQGNGCMYYVMQGIDY